MIASFAFISQFGLDFPGVAVAIFSFSLQTYFNGWQIAGRATTGMQDRTDSATAGFRSSPGRHSQQHSMRQPEYRMVAWPLPDVLMELTLALSRCTNSSEAAGVEQEQAIEIVLALPVQAA